MKCPGVAEDLKYQFISILVKTFYFSLMFLKQLLLDGYNFKFTFYGFKFKSYCLDIEISVVRSILNLIDLIKDPRYCLLH